MSQSFFEYQQGRMRALTLWGLVNTILSPVFLRRTDPLWRQVGLQSLIWGLLNTGLALFDWQRSRRLITSDDKDERLEQREVRRWKRIILINLPLDVLYLIAGSILLTRSSERRDLRGMGGSFLVQGGVILALDSTILRDIYRHWAKR